MSPIEWPTPHLRLMVQYNGIIYGFNSEQSNSNICYDPTLVTENKWRVLPSLRHETDQHQWHTTWESSVTLPGIGILLIPLSTRKGLTASPHDEPWCLYIPRPAQWILLHWNHPTRSGGYIKYVNGIFICICHNDNSIEIWQLPLQPLMNHTMLQNHPDQPWLCLPTHLDDTLSSHQWLRVSSPSLPPTSSIETDAKWNPRISSVQPVVVSV
jgi:hypothetical protein